MASGAMVAMLLGALRQRTGQLWAEQSRQARELGLTVTDLGRWVGRRDGVHVVVQVDIEPHDPWSVRAKLPFSTPRGFHLGAVRPGRDAASLREAIAPIVERMAARGWRTELGPAIILRRTRQFPPFTSAQRQLELADGIQTVVSMVRQLQRRYRQLIEAGLSRVQPTTPRPVPSPRRPGELRGTVDGVRVSIMGPRLTDDRWVLEVRAALSPAFPAGTLVVARQEGVRRPTARASRLGDLVLDHALCATSTDPETLAQRLARDAVRGPVLDVVAAHPASELRADEVVHVVHDGALDVSGALDRVVDLVSVLSSDRSPVDHATA